MSLTTLLREWLRAWVFQLRGDAKKGIWLAPVPQHTVRRPLYRYRKKPSNIKESYKVPQGSQTIKESEFFYNNSAHLLAQGQPSSLPPQPFYLLLQLKIKSYRAIQSFDLRGFCNKSHSFFWYLRQYYVNDTIYISSTRYRRISRCIVRFL